MNEHVGLHHSRLCALHVVLLFQLPQVVVMPLQFCCVHSITVLFTGIVTPARTLSVLFVVLNVSIVLVQIRAERYQVYHIMIDIDQNITIMILSR